MYADHCPKVAAHMRGSLDGFKRGLFFVVCSIRQPIENVPEQVQRVEIGDHKPLWGHKRDAIAYIEEHAERLWHNVRIIAILAGMRKREAQLWTCNAIDILCEVPGLGIVKAAFVCQLMGFNVACLDTRNIKREGRNPDAFKSRGTKHKATKAFRAMIERYVAETFGHAEQYWDAWCHDVANARGLTAQEVSALHLAICLPRQFDLAETF